MFPFIDHIQTVQDAVASKKEIRFQAQPNGVTVGCYIFMDSDTFDSALARECRGIAFDTTGAVVSRPLHKFFNLGEKAWLSAAELARRDDLVAVYDKLDGSMLATAWVDGQLQWRSKKSFGSDVVKLTQEMLARPEHAHLVAFARQVASQGLTAIFELTHPQARIVVPADVPRLRLLHVRDNRTGAYVLLDAAHPVHDWGAQHGVPQVQRHDGLGLAEVLARLPDMRDQEGFVLQFADGDMVKLKCPWYQRLHRSISLLRERDIALSVLREEVDDLKGALGEAGVDLAAVNAVEARVKALMLGLADELEAAVAPVRALPRKEAAIALQGHPLFGLIMASYAGKEVDLADWFIKNRLKETFSLDLLVDGALADSLVG